MHTLYVKVSQQTLCTMAHYNKIKNTLQFHTTYVNNGLISITTLFLYPINILCKVHNQGGYTCYN